MPEAISRTQTRIQITMLGGFQMIVGDKLISDQISRTRQLWNLLEYLIAYRHKTVSQEELIAALWADNSISNPASALKNLVYRIRTTFTALGIPFAKEIIFYQRGTYHWNNSLPCIVDIEEFEQMIRSAGELSLPAEERINRYQKALALYRGDFLPGSCYEEWAIPLSGYYRSLYISGVNEIASLLHMQGRFEEAEPICARAALLDPFEESVHLHLLLSLIRQGKSSAALEHYSYVTDLFYRELGIRPTEAMRRLYREISKSVNNVEHDINVIMEDLSEQWVSPGAFYCEYEVFKNLYRVEARSASRTGQTVFIALLTVTDAEDQIPEGILYNKVMDQFLNVIRSSLRKGDVISRFSATQYVLMLPAVNYENGAQVLRRIIKNFKLAHRKDDVKIHTLMQPLCPVPDSGSCPPNPSKHVSE